MLCWRRAKDHCVDMAAWGFVWSMQSQCCFMSPSYLFVSGFNSRWWLPLKALLFLDTNYSSWEAGYFPTSLLTAFAYQFPSWMEMWLDATRNIDSLLQPPGPRTSGLWRSLFLCLQMGFCFARHVIGFIGLLNPFLLFGCICFYWVLITLLLYFYGCFILSVVSHLFVGGEEAGYK